MPTPVSPTLHLAAVFWSAQGNTAPVGPRAAFSHCSAVCSVLPTLWANGDWVFTSKTGKPLNPNSDYHAWKALVRRAGVRDACLHDARHTAATVLLVLGLPERTVMQVMGWSTTATAAR